MPEEQVTTQTEGATDTKPEGQKAEGGEQAKPEEKAKFEKAAISKGYDKAAKRVGFERWDEATEAKIKTALEAHAKQEEAAKSLEQKLAEREAALGKIQGERDSFRSLVESRTKQDFDGLDDDSRKTLLEQVAADGGDAEDMIAVGKVMQSAMFKAYQAAKGGQKQNSQGKVTNGAANTTAAREQEKQELYRKAMAGDADAKARYMALDNAETAQAMVRKR